MSKILIRFDDICPTMDWKQFCHACDLMDKYGIKPLIGVIPDNKDCDLFIDEENKKFWAFVKKLQNKGYKIAMHGVNHVFSSPHVGIVNKKVGSEFAGRTLEEQVSDLKKGKQILEKYDISTDVFFAPAHSYDWNTLKALHITGFKYMSDGKSAKPYKMYSILCLPCRSSGCPQINKNGYYTAVFHAHEWPREDKKLAYNEFCNLLENHNKEIVTFEEYVNAPIGNSIIQLINQQIYLKWIYCIRPILSRIYRLIKNLI